MIRQEDIVELDISQEDLDSAIDYGMISVNFTYDRMNFQGQIHRRIRKIVEGVLIESAFRRYLDQEEVDYIHSPTHFTKTDRADMQAGGRRIDLKGTFVNIDSYEGKGWLLECSALVPQDQFERRGFMKPDDIYIFPFLVGRENLNATDYESSFWCNVVSREILYRNLELRPDHSLGNMEVWLKSGKEETVEILGQDKNGDLLSENLHLEADSKKQTENEFYSLLVFRSKTPPTSRIRYKTSDGDLGFVSPLNWGDVAIHDARLLIACWATKQDFGEKSRPLRVGESCPQYQRTFTDNYEVRPLSKLSPMKDLREEIVGG